MVLRAPDYLQHLQGLLPQGHAWTTDRHAVLTRFLLGLAFELARVDGRAQSLLLEADPRTTRELLTDWERALGLPDPCTGQPETLQERRAAIVTRLTESGGLSRAFFIGLAAALGFEVSIEEPRQFRCGSSRCGDRLFGDEWRYVWIVHAPHVTVRFFRCGSSRCGERLGSWSNQLLECVFRRLNPAHAHLRIVYDGPQEQAPQLFAELIWQDGSTVRLPLNADGLLPITGPGGQQLLVQPTSEGIQIEDENGQLVTVRLIEEQEK
ncbi:MAG: YmfQ family protein [bacterium]|nr:YmfQ family protein [bacterium]